MTNSVTNGVCHASRNGVSNGAQAKPSQAKFFTHLSAYLVFIFFSSTSKTFSSISPT